MIETYTRLLPHQEEAFSKLVHLKIGALYMEMGTGKTRTAIELIKSRADRGKISGVIWLCPCSVKRNLELDIRKHSNLLDIGFVEICGIETLSSSVAENSRLMAYVRDRKVMLIVDESSLVKNHAALRTIHITQLAQKCPYRLILNGTPVSKNEADLYSQWYLLDPRILGYRSFWSFAANHLEYDNTGRVRRVLNIDYLAEKIAPYTYQCLQKDCITLPPKKHSYLPIWLTVEQDAEYENAVSILLDQVDEMRPETIYRLFGALEAVICGYRLDISKQTYHVSRHRMYSWNDHPRINAMMRELPQDEKCLIFATYTDDITDICRRINSDRGEGMAVPFYGEIPQARRQQNLERFRGPAQFLVANKMCGAYGLNLQFCHNIIYYSNDWDYGTRIQSEDRVHRLGQTEEVSITDVYARGTIDEQIIRCLDRKERIVDNFKQEIGSKKGIIDFLHGKKVKVIGKDLSAGKRVRRGHGAH